MPNYIEVLKQYRWKCERALNGHGTKTAAEMLAEIPWPRRLTWTGCTRKASA